MLMTEKHNKNIAKRKKMAYVFQKSKEQPILSENKYR